MHTIEAPQNSQPSPAQGASNASGAKYYQREDLLGILHRGNYNTEECLQMIANGASLTATYQYKDTPLFYVAAAGNETLIKAMIEAGADVNAVNHFGYTPLTAASSAGHLKAVQLLVEAGANANEGYALHAAARSGHAEIVSFLVQNGADVNSRERSRRWTPLMQAAASGQARAAQVLLNHGADINARTFTGDNAVAIAKKNNNDAIAMIINAHVLKSLGDEFSAAPTPVARAPAKLAKPKAF